MMARVFNFFYVCYIIKFIRFQAGVFHLMVILLVGRGGDAFGENILGKIPLIYRVIG